MNASLLALSSPGVLVVGAAICVILCKGILVAVRRAGVFTGGVNVTLAICASLLAVIGIMRTFGREGGTPEGSATMG